MSALLQLLSKNVVLKHCFRDYGNCFLLEASRAGAEILGELPGTFRYPSYVQDIMGDIFSLGFGPFRWVCTSGDPEDLAKTDRMSGIALLVGDLVLICTRSC